MRSGRGKQPPASPSCARSFAAGRDAVTLCPGVGDRATRRAGSTWQERHERGGEGGEAHPCAADEELGAHFSKINAWPSEADILPPKQPGQDSSHEQATLSMHTNTPLFSPSLGPEERKSLVLDSKLPMAFPGLGDALISPGRTHSLCHDLELDKNFLFQDYFNHFLLFQLPVFDPGRGVRGRTRLGF